MAKGLKSGERMGDRPIPGSSERGQEAGSRTDSRQARTLLRLQLAARKVLAPEAFVIRLRITLPLRDLDETLLRSRLAWPATSNEVLEDDSVPL